MGEEAGPVNAHLLCGDVLHRLSQIPDRSIQCVVTSPPYWGLRDYKIQPSIWGGDPGCQHLSFEIERVEREMRTGISLAESVHNTRGGAKKCAETPDQSYTHGFCEQCGAWLGCFGLEPTPEMYIQHAVEIFREVRRVLRNDGTLWLNMGDSYAGSRKGGHNGYNSSTIHGSRQCHDQSHIAAEKMRAREGRDIDPKRKGTPGQIFRSRTVSRRRDDHEIPRSDIFVDGIKPKDLIGVPWMLAFALRSDGWWLRQDIVWAKKNRMPESVRDRCTKSHEYLFLLSKKARYYYNHEAIKEQASEDSHSRGEGVNPKAVAGWAQGPGDHSAAGHAVKQEGRIGKLLTRPKQNASFSRAVRHVVKMRNKNSVWFLPTQGYKEAHFATFPEALVEPCILAGSREEDLVLDPFCGSGTTGAVALRRGRNFVGIDVNPAYLELAKWRIRAEIPMFNDVSVLDPSTAYQTASAETSPGPSVPAAIESPTENARPRPSL